MTVDMSDKVIVDAIEQAARLRNSESISNLALAVTGAIGALRADVSRLTADNAALRQALAEAKTKYIRIRAFAARSMDCDDDPEYPMSKADLRASLKGAANALRLIAIDAALANDTKGEG